MEAYEALARELFLADPKVRDFRALVAMREVVGKADARPLGWSLPEPHGSVTPVT